MAPTCPNNGYSPVTILLNSRAVVSNYDPNSNHQSTRMVTDQWIVFADAGANTLQWIAGNLCTNYWIQSIAFRLD